MRTAHLSDDRLVEIYFTDTPSAQEQQHLGGCHDCDGRRSSIAHLLDETAMASHEDVEAAFPAERLARQQVQILQAAEAASGPARVIAFPALPSPTMVIGTRSRSARWIAAAAVAGLVVGVAAGRAGREIRVPGTDARIASGPVNPDDGQAVRVSAPMSDDQFLFELESAIEGRGGALHALDELTPRAWDR